MATMMRDSRILVVRIGLAGWMVAVKSVAAQGLDTQTLLRNLDGQIAVPAIAPDLDCMISGIGHDPDALHDFVSRRFPGTGLVGGSSSSGLMTLDGLWDTNAVGLPLIVAEGVETAQELACLRYHAGTCLAQGYLFARPDTAGGPARAV